MEIKFIDTIGLPEEVQPKPAYKVLPEWYKDTESYTSGEKKPSGIGGTKSTIKRCMPVFDSLTTGYILFTYVDIYVSQKEQMVNFEGDIREAPWYEWPSLKPISFHQLEQAPKHPFNNTFPYPKWENPWTIKTPPGYSVLIVPPFHLKTPFTIFPGVVDTDTYHLPVNFPFVLNEPSTFEGTIPVGTPMAQIIPFKRESWEMKLEQETPEYVSEANRLTTKLRMRFFDGYKTAFRQPKEFK